MAKVSFPGQADKSVANDCIWKNISFFYVQTLFRMLYNIKSQHQTVWPDQLNKMLIVSHFPSLNMLQIHSKTI